MVDDDARFPPDVARAVGDPWRMKQGLRVDLCRIHRKKDHLGLAAPGSVGADMGVVEHLAQDEVPDHAVALRDQAGEVPGKAALQPLVGIGGQQPVGPQVAGGGKQAGAAGRLVRQRGLGAAVVPGDIAMHAGADVLQEIGDQMRVIAIGKHGKDARLSLCRVAKHLVLQHEPAFCFMAGV